MTKRIKTRSAKTLNGYRRSIASITHPSCSTRLSLSTHSFFPQKTDFEPSNLTRGTVSSNRKKTQSFIEKQVQKNDLPRKTKGSFIFKKFKSISNNSNFMGIFEK